MVKETEEGTFLPSLGTFIGQNVCVGGYSDFYAAAMSISGEAFCRSTSINAG
jgi:hypothetical protein